MAIQEEFSYKIWQHHWWFENNEDQTNDKGGKCYICIKNLCGMRNKESVW